MDPVYDEYFRNRFVQLNFGNASLSRPAFPPDAQQDAAIRLMVGGAINRTRESPRNRGGARLRGDAELLLYLAFSELVARPVITVRPPTAVDGLPAAIAADVAQIAGAASEQHTGEGLVSAHDIVNVTARSWNVLRSAQWQLWD